MQVTKQECKNYRDIIKRPIALIDMKNKSKRNEYKNSEELKQDFELLK